MKFAHLSDLHIGKKINRIPFLDEQEYILNEIHRIILQQNPDGILIAGDIYDNSNPAAEAMSLFSSFLSRLSSYGKPVFIISGNHDSAERISYMNGILKKENIFVSDVYNGEIHPIVLDDQYGNINIYLLPFIKPSVVRNYLPDNEKQDVDSYNSALKKAVGKMKVDPKERNIILSHQFITGSERSESEDLLIGGLENVDASIFDDFDYVALGHLHRPQSCGRREVRYCGSPLKYSFSEIKDKKTLTIVEIKEKGNVSINEVPLIARHEWYDLKGTYNELSAKSFYDGKNYEKAFVRITLTDEETIPDAVGKLKSIYQNMMELRYDNTRTRAGIVVIEGSCESVKKTPLMLFEELFEKQNGRQLNEKEKKFFTEIENKLEGTNL